MGLSRELMALRALREIADGSVVNLGLGMPTLIADLLTPERQIYLHAENGLLGFGPYAAEGEEDPDVVNAGGHPVTLLPGASFFDSAESFAIVRGGRLDYAVLGGMQVAENGDLANWMVPDRGLGGIGGAMDIAACARTLIVLMEHTTRRGEPRLLRRCTFPLTAAGVVDLVITDLAVIAVTVDGFELRELAPGVTQAEVCARTAAPLRAAPDLCEVTF
jgi:3-oxoacid CoA-transferase subunit B